MGRNVKPLIFLGGCNLRKAITYVLPGHVCRPTTQLAQTLISEIDCRRVRVRVRSVRDPNCLLYVVYKCRLTKLEIIQPAAFRAGIKKTIGWHTFRHTYSSSLIANGENVKVVQELMRHANSRFTLDVYTQARVRAKREAQQRIVEMVLPEEGPDSKLRLEHGGSKERFGE